MTEDVQLPDIEIARYALRTFALRENDHLWPVAVDMDCWIDGTCTAECWASDAWAVKHSAPDLNCRCGVYGTLSLSHLYDQWAEHSQRLVCVIAAEGSTILGNKGLRTAYARVVAYWGYDREIRRVARKQFVGAKQHKRLKAMLAEYEIPIRHKEKVPQE
jgi:hypothetical protein